MDGVLQFDFPGSHIGAVSSARVSSFVIGAENSLAAPPTRRLLDAENLGDAARQFNPLVIVGPSGSGKSHLAQGIVRAWHARLASSEIAYFTAADFGRERQAAEIDKRLEAWRSQTRAVRLFVLEDVDRLRRRATIQGELRETLDALVAAGAVVIVTSLREPLLCESLEAGLRDRLAAGLTVRLQRPELAARRAILAEAASARGMDLDAAELDRLAQRDCAVPAQLLGRLTATPIEPSGSLSSEGRAGEGGAAGTRATHTAPNPSSSRVGEHRDQNSAASLSIKQILSVTARYFGVTQAALTSASRRTSLVEARNVVVHLARRLTNLSYADIGRTLGHRDHSTIMHGERRLADRLSTDPTTQQAVDELERILRS